MQDNALELIQAYSKYLIDCSQQNLQHVENNVNSLKKMLDKLQVCFSFSEITQEILIELKDHKNITCKTLLNTIIDKAKKQKFILINGLKNKDICNNNFYLNLLKLDEILNEFIENNKWHINTLQQSETDNKISIQSVEKIIKHLEDKKNVARFKKQIRDHFITKEMICKYTNAIKSIKTKPITELGRKAHDHLLSDKISEHFKDELKSLGKSDIQVELDTRSEKGIVLKKLKILDYNVCDILSDGEQKAIALALFLAENEIQNSSCPMIFDDPVTSIDHSTSECLAERLIKMSSDRQIIIFTHSKFFYGHLKYWCKHLKDDKNVTAQHICKDYSPKGCGNKKGNHIFIYKVEREDKTRTGLIKIPMDFSLKFHIDKSINYIKDDCLDSDISYTMKRAIECFIDEKILLNIVLVKDHMRAENIQWETLQKLSSQKIDTEKLKEFWDALSYRGTHLSQDQCENPLIKEDFHKMIEFLKSYD